MVKIKINGTLIETSEDQTILQTAIANDIDIPHYCWDERLKSFGGCGMCVVEIEGQPKLLRSCSTTVSEGMVVETHTEKTEFARKTALDLYMNDHKGDCIAPCNLGCPARTDVQSYVNFIGQGEWDEAVRVIKESIPIPSAIGKVCPHPCEEVCNRKEIEEPISIASLKYYAADKDLESDSPYKPEVAPDTGKSIGVIGSGPAGLSAANYLRILGHDVTIYEMMPAPGGMLRYGIPDYRLANSVIDQEVKLIEDLGVKFVYNTKIGDDITLEELRKLHDAVFVGIGAWASSDMRTKGDNLQGVIGGIEFLRDVTEGTPVELDDLVVVVGGGNTAMDVARTALRMGKEVHVAYRRTEEQMPADSWEIEEAREEGIIFDFLVAPVEIEGENGKAVRMVCQKMQLGEPDASGRRRPEPIEGEFITYETSSIISAIGQKINMGNITGLNLTDWGTIDVEESTFMTSMEGVFAGGDVVGGPTIAIDAIADGKYGAQVIHSYLNGNLTPHTEQRLVRKERTAADWPWIEQTPRVLNRQADPLVRAKNWDLVTYNFSDEEAVAEASRCLDCGCHAYENCDLLDGIREYKIDTTLQSQARPNQILLQDHPFFYQDQDKCILCGNCVRMCEEQMDIGALGFVNRGNDTVIEFAANDYNLAKCVSCGNCVNVCPTGALLEKPNTYFRNQDTEIVESTCPYCGVGCSIDLHVTNGKVVRVEPTVGKGVNQGLLCVKGKFAHNFINHPDRLTTPLIKRNGVFEEASWDEALDLIASKVKETQAKNPTGFAGLTSARCTNEDNYMFQKFLRMVSGTNNVDHCARLCHSSSVAALGTALGSGAMTNAIEEIQGVDTIFLTGANTTSTHPVIASLIKQALRNGTKMVVADPREIEFAKMADVYVQIKPGTNLALFNGMAHHIWEQGMMDEDFIAARTEGLDAFIESIKDFTVEQAAEICECTPEKIKEAAELYARPGNSAIYYGMGITQHTTGTNSVKAMINLALMTGNVGKENTGVNPLRGQNNVQGACDMGGLPDIYMGYQKVTDPAVKQKFEDSWGVPMSSEIGLTVGKMMEGMYDGSIDFMYIMGENPLVSDPDLKHVREAFDRVDFCVVQDIFLTETAEKADVVLPATSFAEKFGTFTNTDRHVQFINPAIAPIGLSRPDWEVFRDLLERLGHPQNLPTVEDAYDEMRSLTPIYGGISYKRIKETQGKLQWPCPTEDHPGTLFVHKDKFTRGLGLFSAVHYQPSAEVPDDEYPIIMTTGRTLYHYHTRTMTGKNPQIVEKLGPNFIEINAETAKKYGVVNGQPTYVSSRRGTTEAVVHVTEDIKDGIIFMPFHYASGANELTQTETDPNCDIPELKVSAVRLHTDLG